MWYPLTCSVLSLAHLAADEGPVSADSEAAHRGDGPPRWREPDSRSSRGGLRGRAGRGVEGGESQSGKPLTVRCTPTENSKTGHVPHNGLAFAFPGDAGRRRWASSVGSGLHCGEPGLEFAVAE